MCTTLFKKLIQSCIPNIFNHNPEQNKSSADRYAVYLTDRAVFIMAGYIMILNVIYPFSSHTAVIFPLCDSTIDFASDNPIPDPPVSEFLELSGL